ncbi:hypothetical protein CAOG_00470 [Capsaspora owczarzaki ATCC 30864]|nr:hypothetical protein CAOG_00470 [Capsaspora owczarzaki ATCC 30864]|eukprot:XP_004365341.1 hypothetical protein CAOG_00470 [Capsaspora owczarzaki ATCC 30864]
MRSTKLILSVAAVALLATLAWNVAPAAASPAAPERIRAALLGAFVGDALALSTQGEYQSNKIRSAFPKTIREFAASIKKSKTNEGKFAGDLTEVGQVVLATLTEVEKQYESGSSQLNVPAIQTAISSAARQAYGAAPPSTSNTLDASLRFLPLVGVESDETVLATKARLLSDATHDNEDPRDAAEFLARVIYRIVHIRQSPNDAINAVLKFMLAQHQDARNRRLKTNPSLHVTGDSTKDDDYDDGAVRLARWISYARKAATKAATAQSNHISFDHADIAEEDGYTHPKIEEHDTIMLNEEAITYILVEENNFDVQGKDSSADSSSAKRIETEEERNARESKLRNRPKTKMNARSLLMISKSGATEAALPAAIYLVLRSKNLEEALIANALLGGDAASRGMVIGMIFGASQGIEAIPARWISSLRSLDSLNDGLARLPLVTNLLRHSDEL